MGDTYAGDSDAKRVVRAEAWRAALLLSAGVDGQYVFLASRDAAEYRTLRSYGLGARAVGWDRDENAIRAASAKFPDADLRHGDVTGARGPIAVASLDFCGPQCAETFGTVESVWGELAVGGVMLSWFLKGRDGAKTILPGPNLSRKIRRAVESKGALCRASPATEVRKSVFHHLCGEAASARFGLDRAHALVRWLLFRTAGEPSAPIMVASLVYTASSPMLCVVMYKAPKLLKTGYIGDMRRVYAVGEVAMRRQWETWGELHTASGIARGARVRDYAMTECSSLGSSAVADRLNLDVGTVAAWRAHAARGTYANKERAG